MSLEHESSGLSKAFFSQPAYDGSRSTSNTSYPVTSKLASKYMHLTSVVVITCIIGGKCPLKLTKRPFYLCFFQDGKIWTCMVCYVLLLVSFLVKRRLPAALIVSRCIILLANMPLATTKLTSSVQVLSSPHCLRCCQSK
jgi:hypothetical protein